MTPIEKILKTPKGNKRRSSRAEVFCEKVFLEILKISQENTCATVSFLIKVQVWGLRPATLLKKETLAQVFLWILRNL